MSFSSSGYNTKSPNGIKFVPSTVDETLFGERKRAREPVHATHFEPPWTDNGKTKPKKLPKPLLFYCPSTPSRPASSSSSRATSSPSRGYQPVKFYPSYVDDSLFGGRKSKRSDSPPPREFEPPWLKESEKRKVRPILFDCNSRLVFDNTFEETDTNRSLRTPQSSCSSLRMNRRPQSTSVGNIPRSGSTLDSRKPPWR